MLRMTEVLNFSLRELPHTYQTGSWGNLIPVGLADLCCRKGQFATIVVQQIPACRSCGVQKRLLTMVRLRADCLLLIQLNFALSVSTVKFRAADVQYVLDTMIMSCPKYKLLCIHASQQLMCW